MRALTSTLLLMLLLGSGCATSTRIQVTASASTNAGEPVYMMVRSGEQIDLEEPYDNAAQRMFTREKDVKLVKRHVILPGAVSTVTVETPEEEDLGIYFFFTKYEEKEHRYRVVVSRTKLPAQIFIQLGDNEVTNSTYRER